MTDLLTLLVGAPAAPTPHERDVRGDLLDRMASVGALGSGVLALMHVFLGWSRLPTTLVLAAIALACLFTRRWVRHGRHEDSALLLTTIVIGGTTAALATGLGLRDGGTGALVLVVIVGALLVGRDRIAWVLAGALAAVALLADLHARGRIAGEGPVPIIEIVTLVVVLVITSLVAALLLQSIERHLGEIRRAEAERAHAHELTLEGWARVLELRDEETEGHSRRVTTLAVELARAMGLDDERIAHVRHGALLHDIGKLGIPDGILRKPGPLTADERANMERHPELAMQMLSGIGFPEPALAIPHAHHERWDGTGYPRRLAGEAIPLEARLFSVVDVWEALTSDRPYRRAWPVAEANRYVREQAGRHFDPAVVDAFLALLERRPELLDVLASPVRRATPSREMPAYSAA